jgi:hypothetical protein
LKFRSHRLVSFVPLLYFRTDSEPRDVDDEVCFSDFNEKSQALFRKLPNDFGKEFHFLNGDIERGHRLVSFTHLLYFRT